MQLLDHRTFYALMIAGAKEVIHREQELNAINVFPVADGDTGSNLAHLMRMILRESRWCEPSVHMLDSIKQACLKGSRGNSGMIFSQFIIAMCDFLRVHPALNGAQFVEMCEHSAAMSRRSVQDPQEGTVLTVMKDWALALRSRLRESDLLLGLLQPSLQAAFISLERTKDQLPILHRHGIVDAGAKGFVHFLQGFVSSLSETAVSEEQPTSLTELTFSEGNASSHFLAEPPELRYCAEFLIDVKNDWEKLQHKVAAMGNSMVAVGNSHQGKIHIHTNVPDQIAEAIHERGHIVYQKVDDMQRQYDMLHRRQASVALVVDSACDIPEAWLDRYQIYRIPLLLELDGSVYLDKVTLRSQSFYDKLETLSEPARTSQPAQETISALYEQLLHHYDHVISIHLAKPLSGTFDACRQAASLINADRIHVIDSRTLSGAYGLLVLQTAEAIKAGKSVDDVRQSLLTAIPRSEILVSVPTLEHMIRGGRVSPMQGLLAKWLRMKPIVSLNHEGKSKLYGKTLFQRSNLRKMLKHLANLHARNPIEQYVVLHAEAEVESRTCVEAMTRLTGRAPVYVTSVSPVIGLNAGKGAVSVAMLLSNTNMREEH
ncbi:DegV family protein [Paenibacillus whitsoniae]|uniref:DegV family EDD domain-containing protein n=1 Tax=Paenibacillus whitsoniae TaxID=2496558 RepID=A0A3S0BPN6_9BACL|nr:DegV family protein [Paenibacillus whitsoniae]RTE11379.1 DegV family EDD domain-containing protein [Paenibacillus whitsoniae]